MTAALFKLRQTIIYDWFMAFYMAVACFFITGIIQAELSAYLHRGLKWRVKK